MGAALALLVLSVVVMIIVGVVGHKDTDHRHDAEQRSRPKYRQPKTEHEIYKEREIQERLAQPQPLSVCQSNRTGIPVPSAEGVCQRSVRRPRGGGLQRASIVTYGVCLIVRAASSLIASV